MRPWTSRQALQPAIRRACTRHEPEPDLGAAFGPVRPATRPWGVGPAGAAGPALPDVAGPALPGAAGPAPATGRPQRASVRCTVAVAHARAPSATTAPTTRRQESATT
ncbi:hypothetical protein HC031_10765 [Planosporangium thailandense]|uniref:Uncharacterized protein n=1 Tax=Planosporangium thailandense TaxID=765197 RepID=A0ABX0XVW9_9ACTN|nr:hypothetical protein [Planosporangium thailandense]NJC70187.1 hypothetical protein [Planosporangium thailandense]